ncbi:MAG: hypothetical protein CL920_28230 [Deltaproteobacteria bacterium]|nr:hypothetical protein [Deltaproteobacteria bacterium]MBU52602.1 hypothetical protein [Deltaproteobacteria bacterium]|tara:strand:+ start:7039 stop:10554 length:3516 start_codon:yes stop_codon:yes gene_type:complete
MNTPKRTNWAWYTLGMLALLFVACAGEPTVEAPSEPPILTDSFQVLGVFSPAGGVLCDKDKKVCLVAAQGAFERSVHVKIRAEASTEERVVTDVYTIELEATPKVPLRILIAPSETSKTQKLAYWRDNMWDDITSTFDEQKKMWGGVFQTPGKWTLVKEGDVVSCTSGEEKTCTGEGTCQQTVKVCQQGKWTECTPLAVKKEEECNGKDDDCDGVVDNIEPVFCYNGPKDSAFVGLCRPGQSACVNGKWGECKGETLPATEACNRIDDNCDGQVDEGCSCVDGTTQSCGGGTGACLPGTQRCQNGRWGECTGEGKPKAEICNGKDDDCDGEIDNNLSSVCFTGPPGTEGVGECRKGKRTCVAGAWTACVGSIVPVNEVCNGKDDDCDGTIDESFPGTGQSCDSGLLGPCLVGTQACRSGYTVCVPVVKPIPEACDGKDNDCDGKVDNTCICTPGEVRVCSSDVGACKKGKQTCQAGTSWGPCIGGVEPVAETCNGVDDDCDGQVDDLPTDCYVGDPAYEGVGECNKGTRSCTNGVWTACIGSGQPSVDICNGKDDDCDGKVDEAFSRLGTPCSQTNGACKNTGEYVCLSDGSGTVCNAPMPLAPQTEVCNWKDDDCDGRIDEFTSCSYLCDSPLKLASPKHAVLFMDYLPSGERIVVGFFQTSLTYNGSVTIQPKIQKPGLYHIYVLRADFYGTVSWIKTFMSNSLNDISGAVIGKDIYVRIKLSPLSRLQLGVPHPFVAGNTNEALLTFDPQGNLLSARRDTHAKASFLRAARLQQRKNMYMQQYGGWFDDGHVRYTKKSIKVKLLKTCTNTNNTFTDSLYSYKDEIYQTDLRTGQTKLLLTVPRKVLHMAKDGRGDYIFLTVSSESAVCECGATKCYTKINRAELSIEKYNAAGKHIQTVSFGASYVAPSGSIGVYRPPWSTMLRWFMDKQRRIHILYAQGAYKGYTLFDPLSMKKQNIVQVYAPFVEQVTLDPKGHLQLWPSRIANQWTSCQSDLSYCFFQSSRCNGRCVDVLTDVKNCGGCGLACEPGETCFDGVCGPTLCAAGKIRCADGCVDITSDRVHCGACGNICDTGFTCQQGVCKQTCTAGQTMCGNTCHDLQTDDEHCSACGTACLNGSVCVGGACQCPASTTKCGNQCANTQQDANNCGGCGVACQANEICYYGKCQSP